MVTIITDWFLPAYKAGGPVQSLANLVTQKQTGVSYQIICSNKDLNGEVIAIEKDGWLSYNPWTEVFYSSNGVNKSLLNTKTDILFIIGIYSWQYNLKPILLSKTPRKIVSARGMLHPGALSQKPLKKKLYLALWKAFGLHKRVEFHASNEEEKGYIQAIFGHGTKVHVAANLPRIFERQPVKEKERGSLHLVSVALLSPMKNILLVLQALKNSTAAVHYHIYGPVKDKAYWQQCKELIETLPPNITVNYHGDVHPQKVEETLQNAQVFILPSKSENFGHAIYEALSACKPVITSHHTPWNDLKEKSAGWNVSLKSGNELTEAIQFFSAMNREELEAWSQGAKEYAETAIDIEAIKKQYRDMFGIETKKMIQKDLTKAG